MLESTQEQEPLCSSVDPTGSGAVTSARVQEGQVKAGPGPLPPAEALWADGPDRLAVRPASRGSSVTPTVSGLCKRRN